MSNEEYLIGEAIFYMVHREAAKVRRISEFEALKSL